MPEESFAGLLGAVCTTPGTWLAAGNDITNVASAIAFAICARPSAQGSLVAAPIRKGLFCVIAQRLSFDRPQQAVRAICGIGKTGVAAGVGPAAGWQGPDRQQVQIASKVLTSVCWVTPQKYGICKK